MNTSGDGFHYGERKLVAEQAREDSLILKIYQKLDEIWYLNTLNEN